MGLATGWKIAWKGLIAAMMAAGVATSASAQAPIRIGAVYSTSGAAGFLGDPEQKALRMSVDAVNQRGGWKGRKLEVVVYDTEGNSTKAAQQYRRLVDADQVDVVFGPSSSGESLALVALANESKVPTVMHGGAEAITRPPTHWVFNTPPTDRIALSGLLSRMKRKGINSVAMLSAADGFGQSGKNVLNEIASGFGIKVVAQEEFNRQDPDITAQVLRAKQSNADAMIIWSALPAPVVILRAAQAVSYGKPIYTSYGAGTNDLVAQAGGAAEGLYLFSLRLLAPESLQESDPVKAVILRLNGQYQERYKVPAPVYAQHAYDAFLILEQAVSRIEGAINRESIRAAIEKVDVVGANGRYRYSAENHGGLSADSESFVMLRSVGGKWRAAE